MSRLTKLARIYNAINYLEKNAVSMSAVQNAVGATAGRATKAEAKAFARLHSSQPGDKGFKDAYKLVRGKAGVSESQLLNRAAINTDETLLKLRKQQRELSNKLQAMKNSGANPQEIQQMSQQLKDIQRQQSARVKEVSKNFQSGDQATLQRASAKLQQTGQKPTPAMHSAQPMRRGGSFVEQQAIQNEALQKEYQSLLNSKSLKAEADAITNGTADPKRLQAFRSYQKNNPAGSAQEFLAQSQLQSQIRNNMGGGREAGGMFGNAQGSKAVKNVSQDLQYGKGQYQFGQELQNAQNTMENNFTRFKGSQPSNSMTRGEFNFEQAKMQHDFAQQQLAQQTQQQIQQNAQQLVSQGKAPNMDAALTQARTNFQAPAQSPLQNIPLTPDQQIALKYTGNIQGSVDTRFVPNYSQTNPIQVSPLNVKQQNMITNQASNLKGKDLNQFNQATQTAPLNQNQVRQNVINTQNQATAQQRTMSTAGAQNQQQTSGNMFGGYGLPLAAGAGLLGAGYLYANSGNSQQPTPYQGGA